MNTLNTRLCRNIFIHAYHIFTSAMFARGFRYHRLSEIVRISRVSRSSDLAVGFVSPPRQRGAAMHFSHSLPGARGGKCVGFVRWPR